MITPLPLWILTNKYPAIYDGESATAIEQTAKVYGKMQELITDYNNYVNQINTAIADFENSINQDFESFKQEILNITNNYIACVDMKIANQDSTIAEAIQYMKDNIIQTATNIIDQAIADGEIEVSTLNVDYDSTTESLTFSIVASRESEE